MNNEGSWIRKAVAQAIASSQAIAALRIQDRTAEVNHRVEWLHAIDIALLLDKQSVAVDRVPVNQGASASQSQTMPSAEAAARRRPSGLNATPWRRSRGPQRPRFHPSIETSLDFNGGCPDPRTRRTRTSSPTTVKIAR